MSTSSAQTIEKLSSSNYYTWKFHVKMLLIERDLWDIVDGTDAKPSSTGSTSESSKKTETDEDLQRWMKKDKKAISTISQTINDAELVHVRNAESSHAAWEKLEKVYQDKGLTRKLYLRK